MHQRPDPDQLLKRVQAEEEALARGRLKLFFGAAPGVGKTYAMLEAARQRKKEGVDVVVGVVETHGRKETETLLEGLEVLPRRSAEYKGVTLSEFDLDGALKRRPHLILVDELAHTNAPGSRHAKRWQDVDELLDAGIDVYTTLNVQHWESLNDTVAQITGITVRETVPDTFVRRAYEMELVDLPPEDLLKRLREGKVYLDDMVGRAAENFFKPGNLMALRELALRHTAERVDEQMQALKEQSAIAEVWPVRERLMVGVSPSPMSARLVRGTMRLAARLRAEWFAVHVETPAFLKLPRGERDRVIDNLRLAEKLGAETVTLTGENVVEELLSFALSHNVTRIVLGKPARPRWREWLFGSIVNEIARRCGDIDLHVISGVGADFTARRPIPAPKPSDRSGMAWGIVMVALCTLVSWPLLHLLDRTNLIMIYLLGVVWTAYRYGRQASVVATVLSVLAFDFFFVPPYFTFAVADTQCFLTFGVMLTVGLLISAITDRLRRQNVQMRKREERMRVLYKLSRDLSETPAMRDMLAVAHKELEGYYKRPILLLVTDVRGGLVIQAGDPSSFGWGENEQAVARWVFDHAQLAGAGTDTLAGAIGLYVPLKGLRSTVGVLAIRPGDALSFRNPDELQLLETFAAEIGGALESTRLSEAAGRAEMQLEMLTIAPKVSAKGARLSDLLTEQQIIVLSPELTQEEIIKTLLSTLSLPNQTQAFQAILERERIGATMIESWLSMPHARMPGLDSIRAALGISPEGPVHVWVVFLSPAENPTMHLAFLARVASFFQQENLVKELATLKTSQNILEAIRRFESQTESD
jgi:two-component system sensor histidine kinase KdpD